MPGTTDRWTREMVLALPEDGQRHELFDGALLVTPAPGMPHQLAVESLRKRLGPYVESNRLGQAFAGPADLALGGNQLSQPDLFVLPEIPEDRRWEHAPDPILVIEVLSPGSARFDRFVKRRRFQLAGIPEYWIVDLDARAVERWRPRDERPELLDTRITWHPEGVRDGLLIDLTILFNEVWGR